MTAVPNFAHSKFTAEQLSELNEDFEHWKATEIIEWAVQNFAPRLCITSSMTDGVLIDLAVDVYPAIEVVFIDTGYHFQETLDTVDHMRRYYGLNLKIMSVRQAPKGQELWILDPKHCCSSVKVGQLDRALLDKEAWMSGLRRADSATRAEMPIVSHDVRGLVKINPIINWSNEDIAHYISDNDILYNPLLDRGYPSIGCEPCTMPVFAGTGDQRAGRWAGQDRSECGMHI